MSHSEETTHYKLPLFVDDDTPTWLGDFNEAMSELDTSMKDVSDTNKELEAHVVAMSNRLVVDEKDIETNKNNIDANKQDIAELNTTVAGKAPIDHASDTTNYGIGNETLYGHVKLTDTMNGDLDVNAGVGATPKMVNTLNTRVESIETAEGQAEANIKKLQDGKAPNNHASTGTTYGVGNATNYGHVKLTDSTTSTTGASSGIGATPKMIRDYIKQMFSFAETSLTLPSFVKSDTDTSLKLVTNATKTLFKFYGMLACEEGTQTITKIPDISNYGIKLTSGANFPTTETIVFETGGFCYNGVTDLSGNHLKHESRFAIASDGELYIMTKDVTSTSWGVNPTCVFYFPACVYFLEDFGDE